MFLSLLTADYKRLSFLGIEENILVRCSEMDELEQNTDLVEEGKVNHTEESVDPSAWSLQSAESQFSDEQKEILANLMNIGRVSKRRDGQSSSLVSLPDIPSIDSMKGSFFWDGDHWRFHHGDKSCSITSCFLSSR